MPFRLFFKPCDLLEVGVLTFLCLFENGLDIDPSVRKCGHAQHLLDGFLDLLALLAVLDQQCLVFLEKFSVEEKESRDLLWCDQTDLGFYLIPDIADPSRVK